MQEKMYYYAIDESNKRIIEIEADAPIDSNMDWDSLPYAALGYSDPYSLVQDEWTIVTSDGKLITSESEEWN